MPSEKKVEVFVTSEIIEYLRSTPTALGLLCFAFIEGHLWAFMLTAFVRKKTKGDKLLHGIVGRTCIGILLMTPSFLVIHALKFQTWTFDYSNIIACVIPTIVLSLFLQLVVFVAFMKFGDK
ncbi:MAG: hypothetical protein V4625_00450 [Pseudomonadota bacterium]